MRAFQSERLEQLAFDLLAIARSLGPEITARDAAVIRAKLLKAQVDITDYRLWFKSTWAAGDDEPHETHPF